MLEKLNIPRRYDGFLFLAEAARNPPVLKSHHHVELELNLVVGGAITYVVGGRRITFGKRTLLWMFPAQDHQLAHRTPDAQYYVGVFKPAMIAACCKDPAYAGLHKQRVESNQVLHTEVEPEDYDLIRKTMARLQRRSLDPDLLNREAGFGYGPQSNFRFEHGDPDALNAGLRHLLVQCWQIQQRGAGGDRAVTLHPSVQQALVLLAEKNFDENLGELARACGVSAAYLSRVFGREVGVPLSRYRNSVRLGKFWREYSSQKVHSVTAAAFAAGFGSYAQFHRIFREAYGVGPRASLAARS